MATRRRSRRKTISGNLTDIQKRIRYLETRPAPSKLASKVVSTNNIAIESITDDLVATNAIVRRAIAPLAIGTGEIEEDSITSALIATNAVTTDSIAPSAVTSDEIATGAVGTDEIATGAVTTDELGNDSVTNDKLATNSVNADSIAAGSVGETELATNSVTTDKIANSAVTDEKIAGISGSKIIGGIDGGLIVAGSVTEAKIASLPTSKLTGSISNDQLAGSIQAIKIAGVSSSVLIGEISASIIPNLAASKITSGTFSTSVIPTLDPSKVSGLTSAFTTCSVSGTGISRSIGSNGSYRSFDISISAGTGSNQLAIGNHTHAAGAVGAHTHNASLSMTSLNISGGAHGHVGQSGAHSHGITPTGNVTVGGVITSTLKLKQDISDFAIQDPKNILNLKMKRYKYKNSVRGIQNRYNREWMYGYIAEEVQDLGVEQILAYDKNGDPDGIDYGLLSTLILELVKVQQTEIDSLKEEIQRLKEVI
jgi:hypothetical protein